MDAWEVLFLLTGFTIAATLCLGSTLFQGCLYQKVSKKRDSAYDKTTL